HVAAQRQGLHVLVVVVFQAVTVSMIMVVMIVTVMMVVVVMMIIPGFEEIRLDLQNTVEIECAPLQNVRQRDLAALGAMQFGVRIDAPDPCLALGQFGL